ncbi:hypothetical protein [Streptomyces sp. NPDC002520]
MTNDSNVPEDPANSRKGIYNQPLVGPHSYMCNTDGSNTDMESCLGVAELVGGGYSINGNKPEDTGRELRGTLDELRGLYQQLASIPEIANTL